MKTSMLEKLDKVIHDINMVGSQVKNNIGTKRIGVVCLD